MYITTAVVVVENSPGLRFLGVVIAPSALHQAKVHSIPDVVAGYALGMVLLAFWLCFGGAADAFIVETPWVSRACVSREFRCSAWKLRASRTV